MGVLDKTEVLTDAAPAVRLSEDFLENTKLQPWGTSDLARTPGDYDEAEVEAMTKAYKRYRLRPRIALPALEDLDLPVTPFERVASSRRTVRSFQDAGIGLDQLTALLALSAGVTGRYERQLLRAAPSAGGLFPVEVYLSVRNVSGLEPGLYHYDWPDHTLARLGGHPGDDAVAQVCCRQPPAARAAVVVFLAGMVQRTVAKYGDRGLRYVFLDAGHLAQNLCLTATALDVACMTTCGFFDDEANDLFGLDGLAESMLYVAFLGPVAAEEGGDAGAGRGGDRSD